MDLFDARKLLNSGKGIFDIPLRVTYYARVSTDKDEQLHSLSAQISYYSDFIKSNPNWTFVEGYIDEGLSGSSVTKREAFLRMIADAKLGTFDFIITKEISRFSRNTLDSIKYTQELLDAGVAVLFQNDNINTIHADSELRLTIMSSIAQDEVRRISERTRFGFKRSIESGVVLGSDNICGYKKDNGKLVIIEEEAEMIRHLFHLYGNEKMGFRTVAKWLYENGYKNSKGEIFHDNTLRGMLQNPKYKGFYCGGKSFKHDYRRRGCKKLSPDEWVVYKDENAVPPIVSEELWDKANAVLRQRSNDLSTRVTKSSYTNRYAYSGKIICMEHGLPYHHSKTTYKRKPRTYWRCKRKADGTMCKSPHIYTDELDEVMRQVIQTVFADRESIANRLVKIYTEVSDNFEIKKGITKLKAKISEISRKKDKLLEMSLADVISIAEFKTRNEEFNDELSAIEQQIIKHEQQAVKTNDFSKQVQNLRKLITEELICDEKISDNAISELLDRIEVYPMEKEKNKVKIKVYLKVLGDGMDYGIIKKRGTASDIIGSLSESVFCREPCS